MLKRSLFFRVAAPTIFVSVLLLASCTVVAAWLYRQQAQTAADLGENVGSKAVASELQITAAHLLILLRTDSRDLQAETALHDGIQNLLNEASRAADKEGELILVQRLADSFGRFSQAWRESLDAGAAGSEEIRENAARILESETLPIGKKLRQFNAEHITESEAAHRRAMRWMAWGLGLVGAVGSLAGIVLGYGVARGLRRSIYQLSVRVRDAADRLGQDVATVTLTEDGDLYHVHDQMQGVIGDIEQVVEKLQQREREVLRAEQMAAVGQIAAGVAHELRNPLTSIKMLVQKNRRQPASVALPSDNLLVIEQEIRRMERCLQTFLDFARPPKLERRPVDLASLVQRTFTLVEGRARNQQVSLIFQRSPQPVIVEGDWEQIQQLLVNLTLNALDAMPRGGKLTIDVGVPADQVELRVLDTGPGVSPHLLPRLFEPFVSGRETGLGLGLVVSRRIAQEHGGTLLAQNRPGDGACFVLRLPVAAQPVCADA